MLKFKSFHRHITKWKAFSFRVSKNGINMRIACQTNKHTHACTVHIHIEFITKCTSSQAELHQKKKCWCQNSSEIFEHIQYHWHFYEMCRVSVSQNAPTIRLKRNSFHHIEMAKHTDKCKNSHDAQSSQFEINSVCLARQCAQLLFVSAKINQTKSNQTNNSSSSTSLLVVFFM